MARSATLLWSPALVLLSGALFAEDPGLRDGDAFRIRLEYSNVWNERHVPWEKMRIGGRLSNDPYFILLRLEAKVGKAGGLAVVPRLLAVRYNRGRGEERWGFQASRKVRNIEETIRLRARDLAISWRHQFATRMEKEAIEQQLVGAALFFISGATIAASRDGTAGAAFPGLGAILEKRIPELPDVLHERVAEFLAEALERALVREAGSFEAGETFERRGGAYRVGKSRRRKGRAVAVVRSGRVKDASTVLFRESLLVDSSTGLVLEGSYLRIPDPVEGSAERTMAVRWKTKMIGFEADRGE